jgi:hypothetical protein
LALSMISQPEIKRLGVHHYFAALCKDYAENGSFTEVLKQTVDVLGQPRAVANDLAGSLVTLLSTMFSSTPDLLDSGNELVEFISGFRVCFFLCVFLNAAPSSVARFVGTLTSWLRGHSCAVHELHPTPVCVFSNVAPSSVSCFADDAPSSVSLFCRQCGTLTA